MEGHAIAFFLNKKGEGGCISDVWKYLVGAEFQVNFQTCRHTAHRLRYFCITILQLQKMNPGFTKGLVGSYPLTPR